MIDKVVGQRTQAPGESAASAEAREVRKASDAGLPVPLHGADDVLFDACLMSDVSGLEALAAQARAGRQRGGAVAPSDSFPFPLRISWGPEFVAEEVGKRGAVVPSSGTGSVLGASVSTGTSPGTLTWDSPGVRSALTAMMRDITPRDRMEDRFADSVRAMVPARPQPRPEPKAPPLREVIANGLTPCGDSFATPPLAPHDRPAYWCDLIPVERLLLKDPEARSECQALVLGALNRLGPLTTRQLVEVTGLSKDMIDVMFRGSTAFGKPEEVAANLLESHRGVVVSPKYDTYQLASPQEVHERQRQAFEPARRHLEEAVQKLSDAHEVCALAAPVLHGIDEESARLFDPDGRHGGVADVHALYETMKRLDLLEVGQSEPQWVERWNGDMKAARGYWLGIGALLAARIARPLEKITGYQQLASQWSGPWLSLDRPAVAHFQNDVKEAFGGLAFCDTASVLNAFYMQDALGKFRDPHFPGTADLTKTMAGLDVSRADQRSKQALDRVQAAIDAQYQRLVCFKDNRIPLELDATGALHDPKSWATHIDREFVVPVKMLVQLQQMKADGSQDVLAIVDHLPLTGMTPQVADVARRYMKAALTDDRGGREQAVRQFFDLRRQGVVGLAEFGDMEIPKASVRLLSSSISSGKAERYIDNPYYVGRSRDADGVRDLVGMSSDAYEGAKRLSAVGSKFATPENDRLFEELAIARLEKDDALVARLRHQAMTIFSRAEADRFTHASENDRARGDEVLRDHPGSLMLGAAGFEFMDLSRARDMTCQAVRIKAWARTNGKPLPLSEADCKTAWEAKLGFWDVRAIDAQGIRFDKIAELALGDPMALVRRGTLGAVIPLDEVNEAVG